MKVRLTKNGGIEVQNEPTVIKRAKDIITKQEERRENSMSPKEIKEKVKTTKPTKKRMYAKDFSNEAEYMKAVGNALKNYLSWAKGKNKI